MLVNPCRVSAGRMDHTKECVCPNKVPRIHRRATCRRVALQLQRVDRCDATLRKTSTWCTTVQLGIVEVNSLVVVGRRPGSSGVWCARPSRQSGPRRLCWRIERAVVCDIVVKASRLRRAARSQRRHAGKRVRRFRGFGVQIVYRRLAQRCHVRAIWIPAIDSRNPVRAVVEIHRVHAINAQQQHMLDIARANRVFISRNSTRRQRQR